MPFNKVELDEEITMKLQNLTTLYNSLEAYISSLTDSREKLWTLACLEQSHMWLVKTVEREQLEKNYRTSSQPKVEEKPASNVQILVESREKLDSLLGSIQALTRDVAENGIQLNA